MSIIIVLALALCFLPFLRGFAIGLLIVGAFIVVAHAQTTTETNPMRLAVSGCMFNALQLNSMMTMVDADSSKLRVAWECIGSSAQDLFEKLEMVANQEVNQNGLQISRQVGDGFVCTRHIGKLAHLGYRCYLSIPVSEPFAKLLN